MIEKFFVACGAERIGYVQPCFWTNSLIFAAGSSEIATRTKPFSLYSL